MNVTTWRAVLAAGLLTTLVGCAATQTTGRPPAPTKPTLAVKVQADGGLCLDRESAEKLGAYIQELERALQ